MAHETLEQRFELLRELGKDSWKSSDVFLVKDNSGSKKKNLCLKLAQRDFKREFDILGLLNYKKIPSAHEHGMLLFRGENTHYLLRDFIEGIDLHTLYRDYAFTGQTERARYAIHDTLAAADIIGYIHSKGKYHRDLKPYDLVKHHNSVFLIDLESVLDQGEWGTDRTRTFSAPEVTGLINIADPGKKADLYSLGMLLFDLFSAYHEDAQREMIEKERCFTLKSIDKEFGLDIPAKVMDIIRKATEYDPKDRYCSISYLKRALKKAGGSL